MRRRSTGLQTGDLRRQSARAPLQPLQRGGSHAFGGRADGMARNDRSCRGHGRFARQAQAVIIGGSSAPPATIRWFRDRGVHVNHFWGMTEMSPVGTVGAPPANWDQMSDNEQVSYMSRPGRSMFGVELRVVDDEGKVCRATASSGKLQTRGAAVVKRYFKQDVDCVDADNGSTPATWRRSILTTIQITDRAKDVIKSGGEWISSIELENAAVGCSGVAEAAAIGVPHPKWDERPLLLIVRDPGSDRRGRKSATISRARLRNGGFLTRSNSLRRFRTRLAASSARRTCATNIAIIGSRTPRR